MTLAQALEFWKGEHAKLEASEKILAVLKTAAGTEQAIGEMTRRQTELQDACAALEARLQELRAHISKAEAVKAEHQAAMAKHGDELKGLETRIAQANAALAEIRARI